MPDGTQHAFAFTLPQTSKLRPGEIVLDFFAAIARANLDTARVAQRVAA